jgi:2-deoxy-D-gluconate 3-dehydrogenase
VVTGGNGGIGRGIALGLAEAGAAVAVLARNADKNDAVLVELRAEFRIDRTEARRDRPRRALARDGGGRAQARPPRYPGQQRWHRAPRRVLKADAATWDRVIETNLNSGFLLSQIAARSMAPRKRGKIINIASEYSRFGNPIAPSYAASKGGLVQLTKSMAVELAA